jgi:hypothetical protein
MTESPLQKLEALLTSERKALISGDLEAVETVVEEKRRLVDQIDLDHVAPDALSPVRESIRRNNVLFDQALAGIRQAVSRLGALHAAAKTLDTYDAHGQRLRLSDDRKHRVEKRA